jgi:hypothetical protein
MSMSTLYFYFYSSVEGLPWVGLGLGLGLDAVYDLAEFTVFVVYKR